MTKQTVPEPLEPVNPGSQSWADSFLPVPYQEVEEPKAAMIDVTWLRGALFRQRWWIVTSLIIAMTGSLIVTVLSTPIYDARATVRVSPFGILFLEGQEVTAPVRSPTEVRSYMKTQLSILNSQALATIAAENLGLSSIDALLGPDINSRRPDNRTDEQWAQDKRIQAAKVLRRNVKATIPRDEFLVAINFQSEDPGLASSAANAFADAFISYDAKRAGDGNKYAREYLLEQIKTTQADLEKSENAVTLYAKQAGIVTADTVGAGGDGEQTIIGANLSSINQTVASARAKRISAEQRWRAVEDIPADQLPEVQRNGTIQQLAADRARLTRELTNLRERYNDQFPEIIDLKSQLQLVEQQIDATSASIKAGIRNEFVIAQRQEAALSNELGNVTGQALLEQDANAEFQALQRSAQVLRDQLTALLKRYNDIDLAKEVQAGNLTLLDRAVAPSQPISPSLPKNLLIGLFLGIAAAGGIALVREIFVDHFHTPEDVEDRLGIPVLGLTPFIKPDNIERLEANPFSNLVEAYAAIRSTIDYNIPRDGAVIQMTSSQEGEGKSTTSLVLAELFARLGRRTLLIDCDLRKPSIGPLLDLELPMAGLAEVILGEAQLSDALIEDVHENLHILSVAKLPSNPVELLSSNRFAEFIARQRATYSIVIIDSSPVLGLADAPEIAQHADATVFILEANRTSFAQARSASRRLKKVGGNVSGVILTKYKPLVAGSDYTNNYDYYHYGSA